MRYHYKFQVLYDSFEKGDNCKAPDKGDFYDNLKIILPVSP